jgi:hypothetical protein
MGGSFIRRRANAAAGPDAKIPPLGTTSLEARCRLGTDSENGRGPDCEDEPLVRMTAVGMIEEAGFDVVEAANADDAIRKLETRRDISVVFTDLDMPGSMNDLKLAYAVRGRWPPIKIIATSGHYAVRDGDLPDGGRFPPKA